MIAGASATIAVKKSGLIPCSAGFERFGMRSAEQTGPDNRDVSEEHKVRTSLESE